MRPLPFILKEPLTVRGSGASGDVTFVVQDWPTTDPDEPVELKISITLSEFTKLASSIDVGRDIAFGEETEDIWWLWSRLITGECTVSCQDIADCIETDLVVQATIAETMNNSGAINPNKIDPETTTGNDRVPEASTTDIAPPPTACDLDELWAGIREVVERLDGNGRDVLEDLANINDKIEQIAEVIDLVPLLGDIIKDVADFFTAVVPDLLTAYNAASSPTFLDNVACDLFVLVCDECRYPTYEEVFDYLVSKSLLAFPQLSLITYAQTWNLVRSLTAVLPEQVWATINVWQCLTLLFDANFNRSYGKKTFAVWASFGEDLPNDNWIILCDGCPNHWCYEFSVANGNLGDWAIFSQSGDRAVLYADGWGPVQGGTWQHLIQITLSPFASSFIKSASFYSTETPGDKWQLRANTVAGTEYSEQQPGVAPQVGFTIQNTLTGFWFSYDDTAGQQSTARINKIIVEGTGDNPFGLDNCN